MRWLVLGCALALDGVLAGANLRGAPVLTLHPVAPPLTRIAALGDATLGVAPPPARGLLRIAVQRAVQQIGTPEQRSAARFPPPDPAQIERSRGMRVQVEADAVALAQVLGPDRVEEIMRHKEDLSEWYGEGRVWGAR